jgi:hypothetical protein
MVDVSQVRIEQQLVQAAFVVPLAAGTHAEPAQRAPRRTVRRPPVEASLFARMRRAFMGDGSARPEPFPKPR